MNDSHLMKIEWHNGLSVGVPEIDEQHKKFLLIASEGIDKIVAGDRSGKDSKY